MCVQVTPLDPYCKPCGYDMCFACEQKGVFYCIFPLPSVSCSTIFYILYLFINLSIFSYSPTTAPVSTRWSRYQDVTATAMSDPDLSRAQCAANLVTTICVSAVLKKVVSLLFVNLCTFFLHFISFSAVHYSYFWCTCQ